MYKPALIAGLIFGALSVMLGAFAAHGLDVVLPAEKIAIFQKGVTYQFYHCFALLFAGVIYSEFKEKTIKTATVLFIAGIVCFSGSLYLYPMLEAKHIDIPKIARLVTPLGGMFFIFGWVFTLLALIKKR